MEYYNTEEKPGYYIVFNHENYSDDFPSGKPETRTGTDKDVNYINHTFNKLGFQSHQGPTKSPIKDVDKQVIFDQLKEVFSRDFTNFGSIFVFILTHGTEGNTLTAYDTTYTLDQLLDHAMQHASPTLHGKPKVFVIQACHGQKMDRGTQWASANCPLDTNYSSQPFLMPGKPDVLLALSSPPGYLSTRNLFIPVLCKSIRSYGYKKSSRDLETLLTLVRRNVADQVRHDTNDAPCKQITLSVSTLTKKLRLKPPTR